MTTGGAYEPSARAVIERPARFAGPEAAKDGKATKNIHAAGDARFAGLTWIMATRRQTADDGSNFLIQTQYGDLM